MARPRSDIRPRVIEAARARFLADGVDGSSLRGIAQDAGTSIGMIYYYFPTKDDLFLGVVEDVYAGLLEDLSVALSPDAPVEERIERLYRRAGAMSDVEFMVIRIVIREALVSSSRLERLMERVARGHLPLLLQTVRQGMDEGVLADRYPLPVHLAAIGVLAMFPQIARRVIGQTSPAILAMLPGADDLAVLLSEIVLGGIGGPAAPKKAH
jgi:AcrR family transcriptional regulator